MCKTATRAGLIAPRCCQGGTEQAGAPRKQLLRGGLKPSQFNEARGVLVSRRGWRGMAGGLRVSGWGRPKKKALRSPSIVCSLGAPTPSSPCPTWGGRILCCLLHLPCARSLPKSLCPAGTPWGRGKRGTAGYTVGRTAVRRPSEAGGPRPGLEFRWKAPGCKRRLGRPVAEDTQLPRQRFQTQPHRCSWR